MKPDTKILVMSSCMFKFNIFVSCCAREYYDEMGLMLLPKPPADYPISQLIAATISCINWLDLSFIHNIRALIKIIITSIRMVAVSH